MTDHEMDKETGLEPSAKGDHRDEEIRNAQLADAVRKAAAETTEDLTVDDPQSPSTLSPPEMA
ncbi:MAG: hypothetical protein ABI601_08540 [bacterium]